MGTSAGNYQLASTSITSNIGTITPAPVYVNNLIANNKLYNGTTSATLNTSSATLSGVYAGDTVDLNTSGYNANFVTSNVGNNIPVVVNNLGIYGSSSGDYVLVNPTDINADILPNTSPTPASAAIGDISRIIVPFQQSNSPMANSNMPFSYSGYMYNFVAPYVIVDPNGDMCVAGASDDDDQDNNSKGH
jgi:hypothetical protein